MPSLRYENSKLFSNFFATWTFSLNFIFKPELSYSAVFSIVGESTGIFDNHPNISALSLTISFQCSMWTKLKIPFIRWFYVRNEIFHGKYLTNLTLLQVLQGCGSAEAEQKQSIDRTEGTQKSDDSEESNHHRHRAHPNPVTGFHEETGLHTLRTNLYAS